MKRYTITLGATTTAGGKVISASSNGSINGSPIALENDLVFCPVCKSQGKIRCMEPRIPELWNGKKVALEDDLCLCGCPALPRLVPNQSLRCQQLSAPGKGDTSTSSQQDPVTRKNDDKFFDDRFVLFDEDTDRPMPNTEYAIRRANGQLEFGVTDAEGRTHLLTTTMEAETVDIYS
ncbi:PAAR domain-containing protein [Oxalobacteraceae bacterium OTU3CAMAD1]|nr:PAAR domain-containing protein [Oxalobacteraceae bacterium OTU3CAMAD1]